MESNPAHKFQRLYHLLGGGNFGLVLFGLVTLAIIPGTFGLGRSLYDNPIFKGLLALLMLNLLLCTLQRWKRLKWPVLIIHAGVLVIMLGALLTSLGYVATVNIYEGGMTGQAFRWDIEKDTPLGYQLVVDRINRDYFPIPVKVGVLRGEEKHALHTLKTGESFDLGGYRVSVDAFDQRKEILSLTVLKDGQPIGTATTAGEDRLPSGFPYAFKLVAYQNPRLRRSWVDLKLIDQGRIVAEGTSEPNHPFEWGGLNFYNTLIDKTADGEPFAGIQIVNDPGRPVVFGGFILVGLGSVALFIRRLYAKR